LDGQNGPFGLAVNAPYLYWTNVGDGTIWQANLDGTNPQRLASGLDQPQLLAVTPPSPLVLGFTPSSYDYGLVATGESATQTFTLANSSGQATGPLTVTVAGSAEFTTIGDSCTGTSLGPGKSCTVSVRSPPPA
jgi:hypothetical protein